MHIRLSLLPALFVTLIPVALFALDATPQQAGVTTMADIIAKLHPQHGKITLGNGLATLDLPEELSYLTPQDTDILLRDALHFPPKVRNLGAIIPTHAEIAGPGSWNSIISYQDNGHVDEDNASTLDPAALMHTLQAIDRERDAKLKDQGYPQLSVDITDWLTKPTYVSDNHALYWAFEIKHEDSLDPTIVYQMRLLGRKGVLSIVAAGAYEQLPSIEAGIKKLSASIHFLEPYRYEDFNRIQDMKAAYDLNDLIIGRAFNKQKLYSNAVDSPAMWIVFLLLLSCAGLLWKIPRPKKKKIKL